MADGGDFAGLDMNLYAALATYLTCDATKHDACTFDYRTMLSLW